MNFKYCPYCREELVRLESGNDIGYLACPHSHYTHYDGPDPIVIALVTRDGISNLEKELLLIKRGIKPGKGLFTMPSGYVNKNEDPKKAVIRELKEETNLIGYSPKIIDVLPPNPIVNNQVLMFFDVKVYDFSTLKVDGTETTDGKLYSLSKLPKIGFSTHKTIINSYLF